MGCIRSGNEALSEFYESWPRMAGRGWFGGQSRARALGCGNGARPIKARWSAESLRAVIPTPFAGRRAVHFSARLGLRPARNAGIPAQLLRRPDGESAA